MANNSILKAAIADVVKQNGTNAITGNLLQQSLLSMIDALGGNYQYAGIATPTTNPGTPDQNVFYLASTAGTYTNFGGLVVADGEIAILKYNGAFSKDSTGAATQESVNQLGQKLELNLGQTISKSDVLLTSGGTKTFNDIPLQAGIEYAIRCTAMSVATTFYAYSENDAYNTGARIDTLNTWVNYTPALAGNLRLASIGAMSTIDIEIKQASSEIGDIKSEIRDIKEDISELETNDEYIQQELGKQYSKSDVLLTSGGTKTFNDIPLLKGHSYKFICTAANEPISFWVYSDGDSYSDGGRVTSINSETIFTPNNDGVLKFANTTGAVTFSFKLKYTDNLEDKVNEALYGKPPIIIKKKTFNSFSVWVLNRNSGKYIVHHFVHNSYSYDMSSYGGPSNLVCGDMWDVEGITLENGESSCLAPNLNFIYKVDTVASGAGFEHEDLHVGMGGGVSGNHGCEVREWTLLLADGKEIDLDNWTEDIACSRFRLIQKSKCYAPDSSISSTNSNNYPKIVDGEPVVTAEHFIDATYEVDNDITWRNRLQIKRNHVIFAQLHGAMLACQTPLFNEVMINDNKISRNHFEIVEGTPSETIIGNSNQIWNYKRQGDEGVFKGNGVCVRQRTVQDDGSKSNNTFISANAYESTDIIEFKLYFQVAKTTSNGSSETPDVFNDGDIISVTNNRKIEFLSL